MKKSMAPSKTKTMPVNSSDARTPGIIRPDGKYSFQSSGKAKATVSKKGKFTKKKAKESSSSESELDDQISEESGTILTTISGRNKSLSAVALESLYSNDDEEEVEIADVAKNDLPTEEVVERNEEVSVIIKTEATEIEVASNNIFDTPYPTDTPECHEFESMLRLLKANKGLKEIAQQVFQFIACLIGTEIHVSGEKKHLADLYLEAHNAYLRYAINNWEVFKLNSTELLKWNGMIDAENSGYLSIIFCNSFIIR